MPHNKCGNIIDGSCGKDHTVLLNDIGDVYVFGNNKYNQCSSMNADEKIVSPYLLTKEEIGISESYDVINVFAAWWDTLIIVQTNLSAALL